jgi:acetoacetyl-CoA synthetase
LTAAVAPALWTPTRADLAHANATAFTTWLAQQRVVSIADYDALWRWSVDELESFWGSLWEYFGLRSPTPFECVLRDRRMPGADWFPGATLNFAEEVLRRASEDHPAIISVGEGTEPQEVSRSTLTRQVAALAAYLRTRGVQRGDRVVAYLPNRPEAVVGLLATAALGAVWAVCGPDFGARGARARFEQLEPKVLIGCPRYRFGGRDYNRADELRELAASLPSVELTIAVGENAEVEGFVPWASAVAGEAALEVESVPFDHPLWILFSSGTTGTPKGIVHGHGGIVLEHLKSIVLGLDLHPGERLFFYCSTSWMVWNYMVGALLAGATSVLYDGSPGWPDAAGAWRVSAATRATVFGTGAAYLAACQRADVGVSNLDLSALRTVISTGSVLPDRAARWLYAAAPARVRLDSSSGGTDVCTSFVGGSALKPVVLGRIGGPCLAVDVQAWDDSGRRVAGSTGEMVITSPMPSMPLRFWNDPGGLRYHDAYFSQFPGVWRHGDWMTQWEDGGFTIEGRSDATLNRSGVRMGAADIYAVVEGLAEIEDSLVIGLELPDGGYYMPLFVVPGAGHALDAELERAIVEAIRRELSPRHVPDEIVEVPAVPRTPTGKKQEVPVKRILGGAAGSDSDQLAWFEAFARRRGLAR